MKPSLMTAHKQLGTSKEAAEPVATDKKLQKNFTSAQAQNLADVAKVDKAKVPLKEFKAGLKVEREHADVLKGNERTLARVAAAHLREMPDYYTRLAKMEDQSKKASLAKEALDLSAVTDPATWHAAGQAVHHAIGSIPHLNIFENTPANIAANYAAIEGAGYGAGRLSAKIGKHLAAKKGKAYEPLSGVHKLVTVVPGIPGGLGYGVGRLGEHPGKALKGEAKRLWEAGKKLKDKFTKKSAMPADQQMAGAPPAHEQEFQKAKAKYDQTKKSFEHGSVAAVMQHRLMATDPASPAAGRFLTEFQEFQQGTADAQPKDRKSAKAFMEGFNNTSVQVAQQQAQEQQAQQPQQPQQAPAPKKALKQVAK